MVITYKATENSTEHKFAVDFIKKKISTSEEKDAFEECCSRLQECSYNPLFLHFERGVLKDGIGALIWRQPKGFMTMREFFSDQKDVLQKRGQYLGILARISQASLAETTRMQ